MKIAKKVTAIAERVEHNYDISINCYHTSSNGDPFLTVSADHEDSFVHFTFYSFRTKAQHKEMLAAFETYLRTGEIVNPAKLY